MPLTQSVESLGFEVVNVKELVQLHSTEKKFGSGVGNYVIEGALHGYTPCKPCEKTPGQYSNSDKNLFDYIQKWANARF